MNNASLLLNSARAQAATHATSPVSSASSTAGASADGAPSTKGFDHALDSARADSHAHRASDAQRATDTSSRPSASADDKSAKAASDAGKDDAKAQKDDDADKHDDSKKDDTDTSLATSMLALIGVPVQVTQVAAKGLGLLKDAAAAKAGDALGALTGAKGDPADATAVAKDAGLNALAAGTTGDATTADAAKLGGTPFAALLATQGAATGATKEELKGIDPATAGPMPFGHAQATNQIGAPMQLQATQPATSPQFSQELGEQIAWMSSAAGDVKEARIKLHPEELGSMDVRVNVDGGKVNVAIMAQHPAAVHAVQQTLSNLDTLLAHHGLSLGQAEVNQGGAQQQGGHQGGQGGNGAGQADTSGDTLVTAATSRVARGLVDEVA
jgi:flagellar hook-length control protein FliK